MASKINEIVRDAPFGQLVRFATGNRVLRYPEEEADFKLPEAWLEAINTPSNHGIETLRSTVSHERQTTDQGGSTEPNSSHHHATEALPADAEQSAALEKTASSDIFPKLTKNGEILVDWYTTNDPANPYNWSSRRRLLIATIIGVYTFVVYMTSAIYTASEPQISERFGVSQIKASLGLSLYVLGYGIGPLLFSPLSEIPRIGRSPVYIITMLLFVILSIPTVLVDNYPGLMILRFLQGFFGSPCLASGGASMGDLYDMLYLPFGLMGWVAAAFCGRTCYYLLAIIPWLLQKLTIGSRTWSAFKWLFSPCKGLALVSLRVYLGLCPHPCYHVLFSP